MISACDTNIWINLVLCKTKYHSRVNTFYSNLDNHMNFKDLMRIKYFEKIFYAKMAFQCVSYYSDHQVN